MKEKKHNYLTNHNNVTTILNKLQKVYLIINQRNKSGKGGRKEKIDINHMYKKKKKKTIFTKDAIAIKHFKGIKKRRRVRKNTKLNVKKLRKCRFHA